MAQMVIQDLVLCIPKIAREQWTIEDAITIKDEFVKEFGNCVVSVRVSTSHKWSNCAKVFVVLNSATQHAKDLKNYILAGNSIFLPGPNWHCYLARPVPKLTSESFILEADFLPPLIVRQNAVAR